MEAASWCSSSDPLRNEGFQLSRLPNLYKQAFGNALDYRSLGFAQFREAVEKLGEGVCTVQMLPSKHSRDGPRKELWVLPLR